MSVAGINLIINKSKQTSSYAVLACSVFIASCSVNKPVDIASVPTPEAASNHRTSLAVVDQTVTQSPEGNLEIAHLPAEISNKTKFSSKQFGVAGSPRVTNARNVRKGGGRYQIGKPYTIRGIRYYPKLNPNLKQKGLASWYGPNFHGRLTANGEVYDQYALSAAHPTMPLPSYARVTNLENGSSLIVRVNDRGPFSKNRVIDLSARAAQLLGYTKQGVAKVKVEYAGKAPLHGLDEKMLVASYQPGSVDQNSIPSIPGLPGTNVTLANNQDALSRPTPAKPANQTTSVGYAAPENAIAAPRPQALINSYMAGVDENSAHSVFDLINPNAQMKAPKSGMSNLVHFQFGPFQTIEKLKSAEDALAEYGILQRFDANDNSGQFLRLISAQEDHSDILKISEKSNISVHTTN